MTTSETILVMLNLILLAFIFFQSGTVNSLKDKYNRLWEFTEELIDLKDTLITKYCPEIRNGIKHVANAKDSSGNEGQRTSESRSSRTSN